MTRRRLLAVPLLLLLSGCGFRLRGAVEIPPAFNPVFIQAERGSPVAAALADQLAGSSILLVQDPSAARLRLRILAENRASRVVAVDTNGKILAYDLIYTVRFDAVIPDGSVRVPAQTLELARNFDNPDVEVLGKQLEESLIFQDFATDAADRILMRLRASLQ